VNFVVRPAVIDDMPGLLDLMAELDRFYDDLDIAPDAERAAGISAALFNESALSRALVVVAGDELVALAAYSLLWPAAGVTSSLYLKELYVRERWRRHGLGRLMMAELRRVAENLGCSRLEWTTDAENDTAQAFYSALGSAVNSGKVMYRVTLPSPSEAVQ
jgi:GNAT superfamily N-acetyltransferase